MSASELQVAYQADDDGTGQIIATVTGEFSARGAAWFNPIEVKRTFVTTLRSFPLTANSARRRWLREHGEPRKSRAMPPQDRC